MKVRPIVFPDPVIRTLLEGRKTVFRWPVKGLPSRRYSGPTPVPGGRWMWFYPLNADGSVGGYPWSLPPRYGSPGDHLWVKEAWVKVPSSYPPHDEIVDICHYRATDAEPARYRWESSIHMPRESSRIDLEITGLRVERLEDITEEEAQREGYASRAEFMAEWDRRYAGMEWSRLANPWVWVYDFRRLP